MQQPLAYAIDVARRIAVVTYRAQPPFAVWQQTMDSLLADPLYSPGFGILFDRRAVFEPVDTRYLKDMVRFLDRRRSEGQVGRCAAVISDMGSFGMGRMAEQLTAVENSHRVFRDLREAELWLATAA